MLKDHPHFGPQSGNIGLEIPEGHAGDDEIALLNGLQFVDAARRGLLPEPLGPRKTTTSPALIPRLRLFKI